ncbi:peptide deformylase [Fusibacter sp. JL298sf-3]
MAIRIIRTDDDPILRKKARVVEKFDDKLKLLAEDMIETMHSADGVGLAAPQIGLLKRLIVVDIYDETGAKVFVNPEIIDPKGCVIGEEGCLSLPGQHGYVERPEKLTLRYQDLEGQAHTFEAEEFIARVLCHEVDHLEGILYIDKAIPEEELELEEA